jgi:cyanophycinase
MMLRRTFGYVFFTLLLQAGAAWGEPRASYDYYSAGDLSAPTPGRVSGGLLLLGGGDWPLEAVRWFAAQAGGGHIVILAASGKDRLQQDFLADVPTVSSVETLIFHDRSAASDARVLDIVRHADGIFLGGGDQSRYVRFWKGTPLNALLDAHARGGKPIGGTSAGLAILGQYSYGALNGGSLVSRAALADPMGKGVTLVRDFLHLPFLSNVITDSHFGIRRRQGRLLVFVARLAREEHEPAITGLGIDEAAALCVDADGIGRLHAIGRTHAWLVRPQRAADLLAARRFSFRDVPVIGVGPQSTLDIRTFKVEQPAFELRVNVADGRFDAASEQALAAWSPPKKKRNQIGVQ